MPARGRAIGDAHDHLRARQAERGGRLAQRVGHQAQHVLGGAHHDRDHDHRQRHGAGPAREVAHRRHHDLVDEQADHDRGRAQQDVVDEAHDARRACRAGRIRPGRCRPGCRSACRSATASTVMIRLPTMALSRPPSAPGGGVISVKTDERQAADALATAGCPGSGPARPGRRPWRRQRQGHGDGVAAAAAGVERLSVAAMASVMALIPSCCCEAQQHERAMRQHDEGDDEQDEAQRDQRGGVEVADRLGEFVGDRGRDGGARRQQRGGDAGARCR